MNSDWYYQPAEDRMWDAFVDYCDENDLDPETEDFEAWVEEQIEYAAEAEAERRMEDAAERAMFGEYY